MELTANSKLERLGRGCFLRSRLETFCAPASLRVIEAEAFANCWHLQRIQLNEGLREIGEQAFQDCGLESIGIPASVRKIDDGAFLLCVSLQNVTFAPGSKLKIVGARAFGVTRLETDMKFPDGARVSEEVFSQ